MLGMLLPSLDGRPVIPITLEPGEVEEYDFVSSAQQILQILNVLQLTGLIKESKHNTVDDVLDTIEELINDINIDSDDLQISESKHVRIEYRDELLSLEVFIGV